MDSNAMWCPDKFCRICLCESSNMRSLSSVIEGEHRTLLEVLCFVSNLSINIEEKLPRQICNICEVIMCKADVFKRRCINSETFLNQYIGSGDVNQFQLDLFRKTLIKDEIVLETDKLIAKIPTQTSVVSKKSSHYTKNDVFESILKKDAKDEISNETSISSCSKENVNLVNEECRPKRGENPEELIKIEESNDFESQNDFDNDFEPPVEYNESNSSIDKLKVFTCSCGNIYNKKEEYKTHLRENYCNGYKKTTKIKVEKKNVTGGRNITIKQQITCPECNLEFDTMKACKLHRRKHKNESVNDTEKFHCSLCMRKFNRKSSYTNHMKNHDMKSSVKFTCDSCKREFQHKAHLDNHILSVHTREKGYPCELCNTNFSTQESLDLHKESHKIEKKHQCKLCNKAFYMLSTLNDHMRTHTGEKPFLCSVCGRGFSQKTNLAQHMRRHQGLKPFKCDDCDRRYVFMQVLTIHGDTLHQSL